MFFMQQLDVMSLELTQFKRPVSAYLHDNLHYTFAGLRPADISRSTDRDRGQSHQFMP